MLVSFINFKVLSACKMFGLSCLVLSSFPLFFKTTDLDLVTFIIYDMTLTGFYLICYLKTTLGH